MIYSIESRDRLVQINSFGAELCSLQSVTSRDEFMWSGDSSVWGGIAPVLFPVVGALKNNQFRWRGQIYPMKQHGFARKQEFSLVEQSAHAVTLSLSSTPDTQKIYPFQFQLLIKFSVEARTLTVTYTIINSGVETMYYNIGSHPAFRLPLDSHSLSDYCIVFNESETLDVFSLVEGVLSNTGTPYLKEERVIPLTQELFSRDALVFKNIVSDTVSLCRYDEQTHRTIDRVIVHTGGAPHLGLWAKPGAAYVCIEPWWGYADTLLDVKDLSGKLSVQSLESDESFVTSIQITTQDSIAS